MIIKITQTESNLGQSYDIDGDELHFTGEAGSFSRFQPITMTNNNETIKGVFSPTRWVNYIPLRYLFGHANLTQQFLLQRNNVQYGSIVHSQCGYIKSYYRISLVGGESFLCYYRSINSFDYVSIYHGDAQVALIETFLNVTDLKYTHKLYILDDFDKYADIFSFFTLYYANFNFARRFHMSKGSVYVKAKSYSDFNDKYDPKWRETHFPDDNFFGKTHLT